jgi:hypothetical protein
MPLLMMTGRFVTPPGGRSWNCGPEPKSRSASAVHGGYYGRWSWTGFTGNTFRDWLSLMIAPFLLPAACRWFHIHWAQRAATGQL